MKKPLIFISIILLICFISCQSGRKTNPSTMVTDTSTTLKPIDKSILRKVTSNYKIYAIGHDDVFKPTFTDTTCVIGKNKYAAARSGYILFNTDTVRLESQRYLGKTFITENEKNIYIFYTSQNYDGGGSRAICIDKETLKIRWSQSIGSFNLSEPIIDADVVYLASLDHLSKLSLKTGKFYWKLEGFYDTYKFNYVAKTIFKGNLNAYVYPQKFPSTGYDTLYVHDATGKITNPNK